MKLLLTTFQYFCTVISILVTLLARHMTFIINLENCVAFSCEDDPHIRHKVSVQNGREGDILSGDYSTCRSVFGLH